jgi:hypothetical protein
VGVCTDDGSELAAPGGLSCQWSGDHLDLAHTWCWVSLHVPCNVCIAYMHVALSSQVCPFHFAVTSVTSSVEVCFHSY